VSIVVVVIGMVVGALFVGSFVSFARERTVWRSAQLFGSFCLVVVVLTHLAEAFGEAVPSFGSVSVAYATSGSTAGTLAMGSAVVLHRLSYGIEGDTTVPNAKFPVAKNSCRRFISRS
jgi:hypothetical protein